MRAIKFKAKNADNAWVEGSLIQAVEKNSKGEFTVSFIVPHLPCASEGSDLWTARMYRVDPDTVCQFTGLYDSKGREIYEGDTFSLGEHVIKVVYEADRSSFVLRMIGQRNWLLPLDKLFCESDEDGVCGNIYDSNNINSNK